MLALCSHAVGATRARGGIIQWAGLTSLTFGHLNGILAVVMWLVIGMVAVSWAIAGGFILREGYRLSISMISAWVAPLVIAAPLMSRDVYSYLMQGSLARDGFNAYKVGAAANPGPMLFEVSADWRNTTTPYGPLHLWIGEGITRITGDNVTLGVLGFKLLSIAAFAVMVWSVGQLALHVGIRPSVAVWLGVANPLSILHLIGGMHNEVLMMAFVCTGLLACMKLAPIKGLTAGVVLIALGVSLKATAAIALPFAVWIFVARFAGEGPHSPWRETWRRCVTLLVSGVVSLALSLGVIQLITLLSGQTWGWVKEVSGNTKVVNPLALPSAIASTLEPILSRVDDDITFNSIVNHVRPYSAVLMGIGLVVAWWLYRHNERRAIQGATIAYLVTCIFNTVTLPWYYTAPLALLGLWLTDRRGIFLTAWITFSLCFMFDGGGDNRLYVLWWVIGIAVTAWFVLKPTLGYTPRLAADRTDEWRLHVSDMAEHDQHKVASGIT